MSESSQAKECPTCGTPLPENAPDGLCAKCLLKSAALSTDSGVNSRRPVAPSIEVVAAAFPQLEIVALIGQGGMGCVFKARQPQLNRFVALKILPESLAGDPAFASRFAQEAQALASLSHPNIVTIHDFGQANGLFYLLMEFVDGVNLRQALHARRFTPKQALAIVPPVCDALQYAHERGIVHRDIKPENLLLDKSGRVKIADFGIAKMLGAAPPADTSTLQQSAAGTPQYMAPEQRSDPSRTDHRADIYSLGVVLYELLTGELPEAKLQPLSTRVQIDVRLDEVVLRALEREPHRRYATAQEFKTAVETVVPGNANPAREEAASGERKATPTSQPGEVASSSSSRGLAWVAFGLLLCATLGTLLLLAISRQDNIVLIFGATALVLAAVFGFASRRDRLGRTVAILSVGIPAVSLVVFLVLAAIYQFVRIPAARDRAQRLEQEDRKAAEAALEKARAALWRDLNTENGILGPREVVEQWLGHVKSNQVEQMWNLTTRESGGAGSVDLRNTWQFDRIVPYTLAASSNSAMVVTTRFHDNAGRERQIAFSLARRDGRWLIRDHWNSSPEIIEGRLDGFVNGSGARFDVRRSDIAGRWYTAAFLPGSFWFHDDGEFATSHRTTGGRTNLTGGWSLREDQLRYWIDGGAVTGRVVNVREDFFQLELGDSMTGFHRVEERPTTGQGTPQFEPVRGVMLATNEFLNFKKRQVQPRKPENGSVTVVPENGRLYIEIEEMHAFRLPREKGIEQWNTKSAAELVQDYASAGFALLPSERYSRAALTSGELPLTFLLPGTGFLQVMEVNSDASGVKLRYKLVAP